MQYRILSALFIFLGSYLPLAIILAVQDIPSKWWGLPICNPVESSISECTFNPFNNPGPAIVFFVVTLISTIIANISFKKISYPYKIKVITAKAIPNDIINYVFPYVVSFMGISYGEPEKLLGFAVFLVWMFLITYKSGQIIMNPLLLMFGWRLYEANIVINNQPREVRILKKGLLVPGEQCAQTIQDFYIGKD